MNTNCGIIRDLLPLYAENMCSPQSRALVEEHLGGCDGCRAALEQMQREQPATPVDTLPFKALSHKLRRSRWRMAAFMTALLLMLGTGTIYHITTPKYARYAPGLARAEMASDGRVKVIGSGATGSDTSVITSPDGRSATVYVTFFNVRPDAGESTTYISVPNGATPSVYYVYPNEQAVLLLGQADPEGAFFVLPRLALNYYLYAMMGLLVVIGILGIALRNWPRVRQVLEKLILIPVAYITAHMFIKGTGGTSWNLMRDLAYILVVMAFDLVVLWLAPRPKERRELL